VVKVFEFNLGQKLLDEGLITEVELCRQHVLNPLCHKDPGSPFPGEMRRTLGVLLRLERLLSGYKPAKGQTPTANYHLEKAIVHIDAVPLDPLKCATYLRSAFDRGLRAFWRKHPLLLAGAPTTQQLWQEVAHGTGNLAGTQQVFVQAVTTHTDVLLADPFDVAVIGAKTKADFEAILNVLLVPNTRKQPKSIVETF
jgi:hypothetical protein